MRAVKKNKQTLTILKKNHSKVSFRSKKNFIIDKNYYNQIYFKIQSTLKKRRRMMCRKLVKKRLMINYRQLLRKMYISFENYRTINNVIPKKKYYKLDPLFNFFKKYSYVGLISQGYYSITESHVELLRRLLRQKLGKYIFYIIRFKANLIVLKRTLQVRMGGGKGSKFSKKIHKVIPGSVLLEVRGCSLNMMLIYNKLISNKIGLKTKVVVFNRI
jgi:ribosomal protein L16/L10AE